MLGGRQQFTFHEVLPVFCSMLQYGMESRVTEQWKDFLGLSQLLPECGRQARILGYPSREAWTPGTSTWSSESCRANVDSRHNYLDAIRRGATGGLEGFRRTPLGRTSKRASG